MLFDFGSISKLSIYFKAFLNGDGCPLGPHTFVGVFEFKHIGNYVLSKTQRTLELVTESILKINFPDL